MKKALCFGIIFFVLIGVLEPVYTKELESKDEIIQAIQKNEAVLGFPGEFLEGIVRADGAGEPGLGCAGSRHPHHRRSVNIQRGMVPRIDGL